jgi:hypothetical protein
MLWEIIGPAWCPSFQKHPPPPPMTAGCRSSRPTDPLAASEGRSDRVAEGEALPEVN